MKTSVFLSFSLILFIMWSLAYGNFYRHFNDPEKHIKRAEELNEELIRAEFKNQVLKDQMIQFHIEVSEIVPNYLKKSPKGEKGYTLRNLASVVNVSNLDNLKTKKAEAEFNLAKINFRNKKYEVTRKLLISFIEKRPYSVHVTEAFFLLTEVYFRLEDYERCILTAEKMLELFPDSELTGFSLLRIGKVYEYQERPEEAVDIYKTVLKSFSDRGIASQAQKSLRSIQL